MSGFAADPTSIRGAITPLVTPFHADGALDLGAIEPLDRLAARAGHARRSPSAARPASRPRRRSPSASRSCARRPRRSTAACRSCPGTGTALMDETLELTAEAQRLGAAGRARRHALLRARPAAGPVRLVRAGRVRVPRPADHRLQRARSARRSTSRRRPSGRLRRAHENIVGIKETTRDFEHVSYVLDECGTDFIALSGIELLCYPMLALGGARAPELRRQLRAAARSPELYDAFVAGDHDARARAALRPAPARRCRVRGDEPGARQVDHAPDGDLPSAFAREPLAGLSEAGQSRVLELLAGSPWMREVVAA